MKRAETAKSNLILWAIFLIPVVWAALLVAPSLSGGLPEILENLTAAMNNPFHIQWVDNSPKCVLLFVAAYGMGIGIYLSTKRNYRPREEHGSARWGGAAAVDKKYRDKNPQKNKILTQNVRIGLDGSQEAPAQPECPGGGRLRLRQDQVLRETQRHAGQHLFCDPRPQGRNPAGYRKPAQSQGL
jgi:hypothetical protein